MKEAFFHTRADESSPARPRLSEVGRAALELLGCLVRRATGWVRPGWAQGRTLSSGNRGDGPPDLDEAWRDLSRKINRFFGGSGGPAGQPDGQSPQPDLKSAGIGLGLVAGVVLMLWMGSGVFIVQEGQQAVVMSFGKYSSTVGAGIQWRWPAPLQSHETVAVTQLQSVEVGRGGVVAATGLRDSSMLTQDENIVDIQFTVQYRLSDPRAYLFENLRPDDAVVQAAESAVREIVGRSNMDSVLYEQRDAIATELVKSVQTQLDRLKTGIQVVNVNVRNVQAPEQVQAAFDDAFKAGADRERLKNEGQAYANDVIPKAQGTAARLREEAEGYRARVIAQAEGDAQRFASVLTEYQKAPAVTRDRLYLDTMQQVYANVSKVLVDTRSNSNLLYLPLDKLMQQAGASSVPVVSQQPQGAVVAETPPVQVGGDARSREGLRNRERESR
jgi:membrane protease subunit HflK